MKPIEVLTEFRLLGDRPYRKYHVVDEHTLFDFKRNNYYSVVIASSYDSALNVSDVNFYKSLGLLSHQHEIGIRKIKSSQLSFNSELFKEYQTILQSKPPVHYIHDFLEIRNAYFIQASKLMNIAYWHKNRQNLLSFFDNAYKMVEVISNYFLDDIAKKTDSFLEDNNILYLKKSMIREIKTMHSSALKILRNELNLDNQIIKKLEIAREIRNKHSAHGVVDIHSYMLTVCDFEKTLCFEDAISQNLRGRGSITRLVRNFDNSIFDKIFLKFSKYLKNQKDQ